MKQSNSMLIESKMHYRYETITCHSVAVMLHSMYEIIGQSVLLVLRELEVPE